jgi:hypothetical protein
VAQQADSLLRQTHIATLLQPHVSPQLAQFPALSPASRLAPSPAAHTAHSLANRPQTAHEPRSVQIQAVILIQNLLTNLTLPTYSI